MKTILVIKASILGDNGNSNALLDAHVAELTRANPNAKIVIRDVGGDGIPHLDGNRVAAFFTPQSERTPEQQHVDDFSMSLIEELKQADSVVLGLPMYNFGVPSQFKSWFDHIARAGITFNYTENGPVGLLNDKPVTVIAARGGIYAGTENDTVTPFIKLIFGLIGIRSLSFVYAEGLNISDDDKTKAMAAARQTLQQHVA